MAFRTRRGLALAAALAPLIAAPLSAQERYTLGGSEVAIYNVAGRVSVERGSGSGVEVLITRGGDDARQLRVETGEITGRETLRVVYPADRVRYGDGQWNGNTSFHVRSDGTFGRNGDRIRVSSRGGGLEAHADLRILVPEGRRVAVFLGVGRLEASSIEGDLYLDVAAAPVRVDGVRGALLVDTGSGAVHVRNVDGEVGIDTGSGSVEIDGIRGPRLSVDTGSGGVRGSGLQLQELRIDTGSGGIRLEDVGARRVFLDTGSGGVRLGLTTDIDEGRIDTGSGSVVVAVPDGFGAALDIDTGSGGIDFDVPVQVEKMGRSEFRGTVGDGAGDFVIETGSGSVRLTRR